MATVSVVVPDVLTDAGLNDGDAPDGTPETANVTAPLNPPDGSDRHRIGGAPARLDGLWGGWRGRQREVPGAVTVMVRVELGLVSPPSSVTVSDAA